MASTHCLMHESEIHQSKTPRRPAEDSSILDPSGEKISQDERLDEKYIGEHFNVYFEREMEFLENYVRGGLHPVGLVEVYSSPQAKYKIIHKLGWGEFSTVWLASVIDHLDAPLR
jgi:hypothetical protein